MHISGRWVLLVLLMVTAAGVASWALSVTPSSAPATDRVYYVAANGSDANDCRTPQAACASLQRPWNLICLSRDGAGQEAIIQLGEGAFNTVLTDHPDGGGLGPYYGFRAVVVRGIPGKTVVTSGGWTIGMTRSYLRVENVELRTTVEGHAALTAALHGLIEIGPGVRFGQSAGEHIHASSGGQVRANTDYMIVGGASIHVGAFQAGQVRIMGRAVTLTGSPHWKEAFASTSDGGVFDSRLARYTGNATGKRFVGNGIFATDTNNLAMFPGDADGELTPGGRYDDVVAPGTRAAQL
jgi:hypothetical protein